MQEPTTLRDAVFLHALKAAGAKLLERFKRGLKGKLKVGRKYKFRLEVAGICNGQPVQETLAGQLWKDEAKPVRKSSGAELVLGAVLQLAKQPTLAARASKFDLDEVTEEAREAAQAIIDAHRYDSSRAGELHVALES